MVSCSLNSCCGLEVRRRTARRCATRVGLESHPILRVLLEEFFGENNFCDSFTNLLTTWMPICRFARDSSLLYFFRQVSSLLSSSSKCGFVRPSDTRRTGIRRSSQAETLVVWPALFGLAVGARTSSSLSAYSMRAVSGCFRRAVGCSPCGGCFREESRDSRWTTFRSVLMDGGPMRKPASGLCRTGRVQVSVSVRFQRSKGKARCIELTGCARWSMVATYRDG